MSSSLDLLKESTKKASELVSRHEFIRVYTHYDADGISAGAIVAKALLRAKKNFQISFLKTLNDDFEYEKGTLLIFADMGSAYPEKMSKVESDLIILDHHIPVGNINPKRNLVHINPHIFGLDGTYELSASGVAYFFAKALGDNNDLSSTAIVGILGDKQKFKGPNEVVLKEGKEGGYVEEKEGINLASGKIKKVLSLSLEPYLNFYKKDGELEEFLKKIKIDGEKDFEDLSFEELQRLSDAIALRLLKLGTYEGVFESIFGRRIVLKNAPIKSAALLTDVVNSCGRAGATGVAMGLLMGDRSYLDRALSIYEDYLTKVHEELLKRKNDVKEGFCMRYIVMEDAPTTSLIATTYSRYIFTEKPLIVINRKNDRVKVSARANEKIAQKLNLAEVMRLAAEKVGGVGGGHKVAAGANIPSNKIEEFLKEVDRICCTALA
ncbi:MAG: DHH family phosphoesterase [Archaeoglobaceae archaeon]|nr:DHH family phosphoesterase [Archaeoglobaceae archaeon]MDW8013889.1 DHH family phosphoesterase [Archaeoglobaceae archaeon]